MKQQDELFVLIKSMNKNEKGYFRKFSGIHSSKGTGDYMKLFECIGAMKEYDGNAIRARFKGQKILNHLRATKHYLKNLIIRALRNYYEDQMPYISNHISLCDAYIMARKGLVQSASKKILRGIETSVAAENFTHLLQWISQHETEMILNGNTRQQYNTGPALYRQKQEITDRYMNNAAYFYIKSQIIPASILQDKAWMSETEKLFSHPLLSSREKALSVYARVFYTEIMVRICMIQDNPEKGRKVLLEHIAEYNDPHSKQKPEPFARFQDYNALLNFMGKEEATEMAPIIAQCRKIVADNSDSLNSQYQTVILTYAYMQEMRMNLLLHNPGAALKTGHSLEKYLKTVTYIHEEEMALLQLQAFAHVALKQFDKALDRLNRIFNTSYNERNDLMPDAYLLNIIVHMEIGNYAIIGRQISIAADFIKRTMTEHETELNLIRTLAKAARAMKTGDKTALRNLAPGIIKMVDSKKIDRKDYIKDWLGTKLS